MRAWKPPCVPAGIDIARRRLERNCILLFISYTFTYDTATAELGRATHLRRGRARRQPVGSRAPARPDPADCRAPHRCAGSRAGIDAIHPLAARSDPDPGG